MISLEAWTTIRHLHAQGHSIRRIARDLHLSRQVVRRAIARTEPPRYHRRPEEQPQLVPFLPLMQQMAEERLIGSRVLTEIRARGYEGSAATFYRAWARLRPTQPDPRVTERFETPPGVQSQFDWSGYTVLLGSALTRVVVYRLILSYSRRLHYWAASTRPRPPSSRRWKRGSGTSGARPKPRWSTIRERLCSMPARRPSSGIRTSWRCVGTTGWSPGSVSPPGRRPRARSSGRSSTWKSTSSRGTAGETSRTSATSWHVLPSRCWMSASTTRPIRHLWRDSLRRRRTLCRCRRRAT